MSLDGHITPNFQWSEALRTTHRDLLDANRAYAEADPEVQRWCRELATQILEPIRARWGVVSIHSWVRCPALNSAVGGVRTSDHLVGAAADLHVEGGTLDELFAWVASSQLPYSQVIREPIGAGEAGWVHVSVQRPGRPVRQVIR